MHERNISFWGFDFQISRSLPLLALAVLLLAGLFGGTALAQQLEWAKRAGGPNGGQFPDELSTTMGAYGVVADALGNSYVTGQFAGAVTLGKGEPNETTLSSLDMEFNQVLDVFVAKYDAAGALLWAKRAGGTNEELSYGIGVDGAGNSYVTGIFKDEAVFGPGEANEISLVSLGDWDIFVAKYDPNGELLWAKRAGGNGNDGSEGIEVDPSGHSYVTGHFTGITTFGLGEANETSLVSAGSADLYVAKYDSDGALLWAIRGGGSGEDGGAGIAVDGSGNSYVSGYISGTATFGLGELNETILIGAGSYDVFVAKYGPTGALLWAKRAGGTGNALSEGIDSDGSGNSYATGWFEGTVTFGPGEVHETVLTSAGSLDIFVAKYDTNGALLWAKRAGGTSDQLGRGLASSASGNSYVTGSFRDTATFGAGEANETTLVGTASEQMFIAEYDTNGTLLWATQTRGAGVAEGLDVAADVAGNIYVTGDFIDAETFGSGEANETTLINEGLYDFFVAKYGGNDGAGPVTTNVVANPNAASVTEIVTLSANIDDSGTGAANVAAASYEIRDGDGNVVHSGGGDNGTCPFPGSLCPVDEFGNPDAAPAFDSVMENVSVSIPAGTLTPGLFDACVRGTDENGNAGEFACAPLVVFVTPEDEVEAIISEVNDLVAGGLLPPASGSVLTATLNAAINQIEQERTGAAILLLRGFIVEVRLLIRLRRLTAANGQPLINSAESLISDLR